MRFYSVLALAAAAVAATAAATPFPGSGDIVLHPINVVAFESAVHGLVRRADEAKFADLTPSEQAQLVYGTPGANGQLLLANITLIAPSGLPIVMMERLEGLTTAVDCSADGDGELSVTWKDAESYREALKSWDWVNGDKEQQFLMIVNHDGCGPDNQRNAYKITDVETDADEKVTKLKAEAAPWKEITGSYTMDFGRASIRPGAEKRLKIRGWGDFVDKVKDAGKAVGGAIVDAGEKVGDAAKDVVDGAKDVASDVKDGAEKVVDGAKDAAESAVDKVKDIAGDVKETAGDVVDKVKDTAGDAVDKVKDTAGDVADKAKDVAEDVKDTAGDVVDKVKDGAEKAVDKAKDVAGDVKDKVQDVAGDAAKAISDIGDEIGDFFESVGDADMSNSIEFSVAGGEKGVRKNIFTDLTQPPRAVVDCANCFTTGKFKIAGSLKVEDFKILDLSLTVAPSGFSATVEIETLLTAAFSPDELNSLTKTSAEKKFDLVSIEESVDIIEVPVPGAGLVVPQIFSIGLIASVEAGFSLGFKGQAGITVGATATIPDTALLKLNLADLDSSSATGWDGATAEPIFELNNASASADASIFFRPKFSIKCEVAAVGELSADVKVGMPQFNAVATAEFNADGVCDGSEEKTGLKLKLSGALNLAVGVTAKALGFGGNLGPITLAKQDLFKPLEKCVPFSVPDLLAAAGEEAPAPKVKPRVVNARTVRRGGSRIHRR